MRKIVLIVTMVCFCLLGVKAQILLEESFLKYNNRDEVENASDNLNMKVGEWGVSGFTANEGKSPIVLDQVLEYPGYPLSGKGKVLSINVNDQSTTDNSNPSRTTVLRFTEDALPLPADPVFKPGSNIVYTSFLVNFSDYKTEKAYETFDIFTYFKQGGDGTIMRGKVVVNIDNERQRVRFSIRKNNQTITEWSKPMSIKKTALLVVKYTNAGVYASGAADNFELFVNPDPKKDEVGNGSTKIEAIGNNEEGGTDLRYICFRLMKNKKTVMKIGGIRIAQSFEDLMK